MNIRQVVFRGSLANRVRAKRPRAKRVLGQAVNGCQVQLRFWSAFASYMVAFLSVAAVRLTHRSHVSTLSKPFPQPDVDGFFSKLPNYEITWVTCSNQFLNSSMEEF